jgi:amino acid transporter
MGCLMKSVEKSRTKGKWERLFLILGVVFFVVGVILAIYALIIHFESAEKLHEDPEGWQPYWAEREGLYLTVRTSGVFFFVLSVINVTIWFYLGGRREN